MASASLLDPSIFSESDTGPELRAEGTYQRFFVQPSVGIVRETPGVLDVEASLSVRASWVDFRQFSVARPPDSASVARPPPSSPFLEPSLAGGVFAEQGLGLTVRVSRVIPLDATWRTPVEEYADTTRPLIYEPLILSVGPQLRLEDVF